MTLFSIPQKVLLAAGLLVASHAAMAQKITDEDVQLPYHKTPAMALKPKYTSYVVEYDMGNINSPVNSRPAMQGLPYNKDNADVLLRVTGKNVYVTDRKLIESRISGYSAAYTVNYSYEGGYNLLDRKTEEQLSSFQRTTGTVTTRSFGNLSDLNNYMQNNFVQEQSRLTIDEMNRRADFTLNPHDYKVTLTLHTVEGPAPAYQQINQAVADLKAAAAVKPLDKAKVQAAADVWSQQLAKANWDDKKSEINKKVANALLENLCAASLMLEDYAHIQEYSSLYASKNTGLFSSPLYLRPDMSYAGTARQANPDLRGQRPNYVVAKYSDLMADIDNK